MDYFFSQEKMGNFWSRREAQRQYANSPMTLRFTEPRGRVKAEPHAATICYADFILSPLVLVLHTSNSDFRSQKLLCANWCSGTGNQGPFGVLSHADF